MRKIGFAFLFIIFIALLIFGFVFFQNRERVAAISNFEECAAAGYPVMESYPARCMTPDKRTFTQELSDEEKKKLEPPTATTCGNGLCEQIQCIRAEGCPESETPVTCPQDCPYDR